MRKKIVAGNWKMNCNREEAFSLVTEIKGMTNDELLRDTKIIIAPPFVHLAAMAHLVEGTGIMVAAQNCASETAGAFTGEVSAPMIKSVGVTHVIIGHSERRTYFGEDDAVLEKKVNRALEYGLIPIFCIGETVTQRNQSKHFETVEAQLKMALFNLSPENFSNIIIAYEPVWAIGTGATATPDQAQEMHAFIRSAIGKKYGNAVSDNASILYGGSCNEQNAADLFALRDVDGGLIGGASLKSRSFVNIVKSFK